MVVCTIEIAGLRYANQRRYIRCPEVELNGVRHLRKIADTLLKDLDTGDYFSAQSASAFDSSH